MARSNRKLFKKIDGIYKRLPLSLPRGADAEPDGGADV